MATSYVDIFSFQFWRGEPPKTVRYEGSSFTRTGVDGTGKVRTGKRGQQFQVVTDEDLITSLAARALVPLYAKLPFSGPVRVVWEGVDYATVFSHLYLIDDAEVLSIRTMPRLIGPSYDYLGGARISVRWTMTPLYIPPEPEE